MGDEFWRVTCPLEHDTTSLVRCESSGITKGAKISGGENHNTTLSWNRTDNMLTVHLLGVLSE